MPITGKKIGFDGKVRNVPISMDFNSKTGTVTRKKVGYCDGRKIASLNCDLYASLTPTFW